MENFYTKFKEHRAMLKKFLCRAKSCRKLAPEGIDEVIAASEKLCKTMDMYLTGDFGPDFGWTYHTVFREAMNSLEKYREKIKDRGNGKEELYRSITDKVMPLFEEHRLISAEIMNCYGTVELLKDVIETGAPMPNTDMALKRVSISGHRPSDAECEGLDLNRSAFDIYLDRLFWLESDCLKKDHEKRYEPVKARMVRQISEASPSVHFSIASVILKRRCLINSLEDGLEKTEALAGLNAFESEFKGSPLESMIKLADAR